MFFQNMSSAWSWSPHDSGSVQLWAKAHYGNFHSLYHRVTSLLAMLGRKEGLLIFNSGFFPCSTLLQKSIDIKLLLSFCLPMVQSQNVDADIPHAELGYWWGNSKMSYFPRVQNVNKGKRQVIVLKLLNTCAFFSFSVTSSFSS